MFQQMGFGLAVAVILDATIVRMVLVPASRAPGEGSEPLGSSLPSTTVPRPPAWIAAQS